MSQGAALLAELNVLTRELETFIESSDADPIMTLVDRRLILLSQLQEIVQNDPQDRQLIHEAAKELLPRELAMIAQLQERKDVVVGLLNQILSGNKAREFYRHVSGD